MSDPMNRVSGPDTFWTTVNSSEAIPGVATPLTWSFYDDATEFALRGTFGEIGTIAYSAAVRTELSQRPDDRFVSVFLGRPAVNLNRFRLMADLTPGGSGDALEQQFFGTKRSGVAPVRSRRRYPVVAARMPVAAMRAPGRVRAGYRELDGWWRMVTQGPPVTAAAARTLLPAAAEKYRAMLHWHGVGTMITQGIYDRLSRLAEARGRPGLASRLVAGLGQLAEAEMLDDLWQVSRDRLALEEVVRRHGCHGRDAGELSVHSWREDPRQAIAVIQRYRELPDGRSPRATLARSRATAAADRAEFLAGLPAPLRARTALLLALVQRFMPLREVGRGGILRALDTARLAARALGAELSGAGTLADPEDVFFLTIPELSGAVPADAAALVESRRAAHERYRAMALPESWHGNPEPRPVEPARGREPLRGAGAGPGVVVGPARVVADPDEVDPEPGEVLVCRTTDPSWASLMSLSSGLVIDVGGPLSHGAILARELGVPCVIGTRDGTRRIRDGDLPRVDGDAGVVTFVNTPETNTPESTVETIIERTP